MIHEETRKLLAAGHIREIQYPECWQMWYW